MAAVGCRVMAISGRESNPRQAQTAKTNKSWQKKWKKESPTPGIEPGPPGWKPGILAIRPRGMSYHSIVFKIT